MGYAIGVLCRSDVAAGFALAGFRPIEVASAEEGAARIRDLLSRPELGVVLVEEAIYDRLPDDVRRHLSRRPLPMVVPFPGPAWVERIEEAEAYIVQLLRQVIGYRVRLR